MKGDQPLPNIIWVMDDGYADLKYLKKVWRRKKRLGAIVQAWL